jgi:hypothetical protein
MEVITRPTPIRWMIYTTGAVVYFGSMVAVSFMQSPPAGWPAPSSAIFISFSLALSVFLIVRSGGAKLVFGNDLQIDRPKLRQAVVRSCLVVAGLYLIVLLPIEAHNAGTQLATWKSDISVLPDPINNMVGTPFRADHVDVAPVVSQPKTFPAEGCAFYLGESDSVLVVAQFGRTYHVYSGNLTMRTHDENLPCIRSN